MPEIKPETEAEAVAALAAQPITTTIEGVPVVLAPETWSTQFYPNLLQKPLRKTGSTSYTDVASFLRAIDEQTPPAGNESRVYLDVDFVAQKFTAVAVFNDHGTGTEALAGWRDHRATFTPRLSEEWKRWNKTSGEAMTQVALAHFLEENIADIVSPAGSNMPTGAEVLTFVSKLEETRKVKYGSAVNLQNGMVQLQFVEEGEGATRGQLDLFKKFAIGIRPFFGGSGYQLEAFLRYRIDRNNGEIKFWFEIQRPDRVLEDASKEIIDKIVETGEPVLFGNPDC